VVGDGRFAAGILDTVDLLALEQNTVRVGWNPQLVARVVGVGADIVLVRRIKRDGRFLVAWKRRVSPPLLRQLSRSMPALLF
jgi:hypothetical protein